METPTVAQETVALETVTMETTTPRRPKKRAVKLGRKMLCPPIITHHWAIKVGDVWYENAGPMRGTMLSSMAGVKSNRIVINEGYCARSGAGLMGGEIVGLTDKQDHQIAEWASKWAQVNQDYNVCTDNCQKFSFRLMEWLTEDNYKCVHRVNAGKMAIHTIIGRRTMIFGGMVVAGVILAIVSGLIALLVQDADYITGKSDEVFITAMAGIAAVVGIVNGIVTGIVSVAGTVAGTTAGTVAGIAGTIVLRLVCTYLNQKLMVVGILTGTAAGIIAVGTIVGTAISRSKTPVSDNKAGNETESGVESGPVSDNQLHEAEVEIKGTEGLEGVIREEQLLRRNNHKFRAALGGNYIACYGLAQSHASAGPFNYKIEVLNFTAQAVAGPGLGLFLDSVISDTSASVIGNFVGVRYGFNVNTGAGARNGNIEAHLLGFGGKIGCDGVEINTPSFGVNACSIL